MSDDHLNTRNEVRYRHTVLERLSLGADRCAAKFSLPACDHPQHVLDYREVIVYPTFPHAYYSFFYLIFHTSLGTFSRKFPPWVCSIRSYRYCTTLSTLPRLARQYRSAKNQKLHSSNIRMKNIFDPKLMISWFEEKTFFLFTFIFHTFDESSTDMREAVSKRIRKKFLSAFKKIS